MASSEPPKAAIPPHVVEALSLTVVSPFTLTLGGEARTFAALIPGFGTPEGMIVDPLWINIEPFCAELLSAGFGYSCVDLANAERQALVDMLRDWEWFGPDHERPTWL